MRTPRPAIRRGGAIAAAALLLASPLVVAGVANATPAQHDILGFGDTLEPSITAGANQVIRATGTISNTTLCGPGGTNDFVFPAADVYVVKAGSVTSGGSLTEAGGGAASTIISATAGAYVDEILAITGPGGTLGQGSYDVVVDECQDGTFDPAVDSIFPDAITVAFPPKIPAYTGFIGNLKTTASRTALHWLYASIALDAIRGELGLSDLSNVENDNPDTTTTRQILDKIIGWLAVVKDPSSLLPSGGPWDVIGSGVNAAVNEVKHYDAIAADPPDPDFKHPVTLPAVTSTPVTSPHAPVAVVEAMAAPAQTENAVTAALLDALQRYQGARLAGDAGWALVHAREIASLSRLLAAAQTRTAQAANAMSTALGSFPGFTALHQQTDDIGVRIGVQGFTAAENQALRNLGYSAADIQKLRAALYPAMECSGCWFAGNEFGAPPPYQNSTAGLQAAMTDLASAETAAATASTALAGRVDGVIADLSGQASVPKTAPAADAGGPYTATPGRSVTLNGSGSTLGAGATITSYAWDTDGDGHFDDATGKTPTVTIGADSPGVVGLEVTDSDGETATGYAAVALQEPAAPAVTSHSPAGKSATATVGSPAHFSVTSSTGSISWALDGTTIPGATSHGYSLTATAAQVGVHVLAATVTEPDGQHSVVSWVVRVVNVDADGDGWSTGPDCDDRNALVNPGRTEVIGNGIDDDCDPTTSDTPLAGYAGQAVSWGDTDAVVLGRGTTSGADADTPATITGLAGVAELAAGSDMGVVVDTSGAVWAWGRGDLLGTGGADRQTPAAVRDPSGTGQLGKTGAKVVAVTSNRQSAAILADGTVAAWGNNTAGALGIASNTSTVTTPGYIHTSTGRLGDITQIAAGGTFLALTTNNGKLYVTAGMCGTTPGTVAQPVTGLPGSVVQIAAGTGQLLILLDNGDVYGCGANDHGQLGAPVGGTIGAPRHITLPPGMARPAQLAAGDGFSAILDTTGTVWTWGRNDKGQLGNGHTADTSAPGKITLPAGATITQLTAAGDAVAIVRADGTITTWGHGTTTPTATTLPTGMRIATLALDTTGTAHYALATRADAVLGWGNFYAWGTAGPGFDGVLSQPTVLNLPPLQDIATVNSSAVGITEDGSVVSWGGRGSDVSSLGSGAGRHGGYQPEPVLGVGGAAGSQLQAQHVYGSAIFGSVYALLGGGQLAEWGEGDYSWLNLQSNTEYAPVLVPNAGGSTSVSGITSMVISPPNLAVASDGSVLSWDGDFYGDCRSGDVTVPTPVPALGDDVVTVASSYQGAGLFLKQDGSLWSCGEGVAPIGRLIDGGNTAAFDPTPGQVVGMGPGSVVDVSAGEEQALALKSDGSVWAWGRNDNCSVTCSSGDDSTDNKLIQLPVKVPIPAGAPIVSVTACLAESYAIRADGTLLAWGGDAYDSLGVTDPDAVVSPPDQFPFVPVPAVVSTPGNRPVWKVACSEDGYGTLALVGDPVSHLADPGQVGITASVADVAVTEGSTAHLTVTLTHPSALDLTLHYTTSNGTAIAGTDYPKTSGTVTIPAGKTSATIDVPTTGNDVTQPGRAFTLTINDPATRYGPAPWASIGTGSATVTINDDDAPPTVSITGPAKPIPEGNTGGTVVPFTIALSHPSAATVTVNWASHDGTATAPGDYLPAHGTASFAPGQTKATVDVVVNGDTIPEPDETFVATLTGAQNATLGTARATATIADDDPVVVRTAGTSTPAPTGKPATATFTITATDIPAGQRISIPWHTVPGSTTAGQVSGSGTVTLTAAQPTALAKVSIAPGDYPHTEQYQLVLGAAVTAPTGRTVLTAGAAGRITTSTSTSTGTSDTSTGTTTTGGTTTTTTATTTTAASSTTTPITATPSRPAIRHHTSGTAADSAVTSTSTAGTPTTPTTPTPTSTTTHRPPPSTTTAPPGSRLSNTGIGLSGPLIAAALLLLVGLGMAWLARYRRTGGHCS